VKETDQRLSEIAGLVSVKIMSFFVIVRGSKLTPIGTTHGDHKLGGLLEAGEF